MTPPPRKRTSRHRSTPGRCIFCQQDRPYFWTCRHCEFRICQPCLDDNFALFTCSGVNWNCPDCGGANSF